MCHFLACQQDIKALADVDHCLDADPNLGEEPDLYDLEDD